MVQKTHEPLYIQIKNHIIDLILSHHLHEGDKIPSTNELVRIFKMNHLTIMKGINELANENIVEKKHGVGVFVKSGAHDAIFEKRRQAFKREYFYPCMQEASRLGLSKRTLKHMIDEYEEDQ